MHCPAQMRFWNQPLAWLTLVLAVGLPIATAQEPLSQSTAPQEESVAEVRIVGNNTIDTPRISGRLSTRVGRSFDRSMVQQDVRMLANLGWFIDVKSLYEVAPGGGRIVIFKVVERPTIRYVNYLGNKSISDKNLGKQTGIKSGGAIDPYAVQEGMRKIKEHYQDRGYNNVQVTILEGDQATDKGIVYLVNEGNSQRISTVDFIGNEFVSDRVLNTKIKSKPPKFKLFKGYVNYEKIDKDVDTLTAYYRAFGFFRAKIGRKIDFNVEGKKVRLTFVIDEGPRYRVRNVNFLGNTKFEAKGIQEAIKLAAGQPFEQAKMQVDAIWLKELYGSQGYVFADVRPETVFLEEPGEVDLIYHIDEGEQFRVGRIFVHIGGENPHTRIQVALNRMTLRPGDIMDIRELKASERRLQKSGIFLSDAASGVRPKITYRIPDGTELSLASRPATPRRAPQRPSRPSGSRAPSGPIGSGTRGQSPDNLGPRVLPPPNNRSVIHHVQKPVELAPIDVHIQCRDQEHYERWKKAEQAAQQETKQPYVIRGQSPEARPQRQNIWWSRPPRRAPVRGNTYQTIRGQNPNAAINPAYSHLAVDQNGAAFGGRRVGATGPGEVPATAGVQQVQFSENIAPPDASAGTVRGFPGNPVPGYQQLFPDGRFGFPGQPYPQKTVDIIFQGQETSTGRFAVGAGLNSNAGLIGNIVLSENNFDWRRPPRSWEDFRNGTAWRGDSQTFRLEASPGSIVNRYLVSFQEPYLFDTPISLGLSGSFFDRRFRDWDEGRTGGRISLGYQWVESDLIATASYRGESVNITSVTNPGLPELAEVLGSNTLHGFRLTVINDTRNSAFLPTAGHYLELSGEQVIGTFDYPRITADFRKYWLIHERPDHSGRHVLSASTTIGYSGTQTPIYEHFFAGGAGTLRGFDFRGASPVDAATRVEVGGEFQWLNTVQYLFPITADETLHGVVFCDFGTVESRVTINDFRVAPGVGLRVSVPALGPAPIALDFAWAVNHADLDDREVFSFRLGFDR